MVSMMSFPSFNSWFFALLVSRKVRAESSLRKLRVVCLFLIMDSRDLRGIRTLRFFLVPSRWVITWQVNWFLWRRSLGIRFIDEFSLSERCLPCDFIDKIRVLCIGDHGQIHEVASKQRIISSLFLDQVNQMIHWRQQVKWESGLRLHEHTFDSFIDESLPLKRID